MRWYVRFVFRMRSSLIACIFVLFPVLLGAGSLAALGVAATLAVGLVLADRKLFLSTYATFVIFSPDRAFYDYSTGFEPGLISFYSDELSQFFALSCICLLLVYAFQANAGRFRIQYIIVFLVICLLLFTPRSGEFRFSYNESIKYLFYALQFGLVYLLFSIRPLYKQADFIPYAMFGFAIQIFGSFLLSGSGVPFYLGFSLPCFVAAFLITKAFAPGGGRVFFTVFFWSASLGMIILYPARGQILLLIALLFYQSQINKGRGISFTAFAVSLGLGGFAIVYFDLPINFLLWKLGSLNIFDAANASSNMRLSEFLNISASLAQNPLTLLLGNGFGAVYTDEFVKFSGDLSSAFTQEEIAAGVFYGTHGFFLDILLTLGFGGWAVVIFGLLKIVQRAADRLWQRIGLFSVLMILVNLMVTVRLGFSITLLMALLLVVGTAIQNKIAIEHK